MKIFNKDITGSGYIESLLTIKDPITRPAHYVEGRKYEPLEVMADWGLLDNYYLACALKYIARYGRKDQSNPSLDLKKAVFYLNQEINRKAGK